MGTQWQTSLSRAAWNTFMKACPFPRGALISCPTKDSPAGFGCLHNLSKPLWLPLVFFHPLREPLGGMSLVGPQMQIFWTNKVVNLCPKFQIMQCPQKTTESHSVVGVCQKNNKQNKSVLYFVYYKWQMYTEKPQSVARLWFYNLFFYRQTPGFPFLKCTLLIVLCYKFRFIFADFPLCTTGLINVQLFAFTLVVVINSVLKDLHNNNFDLENL